jgi:hypothetical protein
MASKKEHLNCICTSCQCHFVAYSCDKCNPTKRIDSASVFVDDKCPECHNELEHDIIVNQNLNLCGNLKLRTNSLDDDTDAFKVNPKIYDK